MIFRIFCSVSFLLFLTPLNVSSQTHDAMVISVLDLETYQVATIEDGTNGNLYKTSAHTPDLFDVNSEVILDFTHNQYIEVIHQGTEFVKAYESFDSPNNGGVLNPLNPYDSVGIFHNQMLDLLISQKAQIDLSVPMEDGFFIDEGVATLQALIDSTSDSLSKEALAWVKDTIISMATTQDDLNTTFSTYIQSSYAQDYLDMIENAMDPNVSNYKSIEQHISDLLVIENIVIENQSSLSANEFAILCISLSVSRHSSKYWYDVQNTVTPWASLTGDNAPTPLMWGDVGVVDLRAVGIGSIGGLITGAAVIASTGVASPFVLLGIGVGAGVASGIAAAGW
jgi:hypothetical protein